jgi:hypothetical protein
MIYPIVEEPQSPIKRLSVLSLGVHRASIPSPSKVVVSVPGNLKIESPGIFKTSYDYKLPECSLILHEKTVLDRTVSDINENGICRICLSTEKVQILIAPCSCTGSHKYVHEECLKRWILSKDENNISICEVCQSQFKMEFEVSSNCLPFKDIKTCKAWVPFTFSLLLLSSLIFICYIIIKTRSTNITLLISSLFLSFFFITCCVRSIFSTFSVCFERKIDSWKIENSQINPS